MTHQTDLDNHANQLNPNNDEYRGDASENHQEDDDWGYDSEGPTGSNSRPDRVKEVAPPLSPLERPLLLFMLEHRGQQIRFEASQWTTEFGILRKFANEDLNEVKHALRSLEVGRLIYRRSQYVVGYSEPKHVFSLTPSGHRQALAYQREGSPTPAENPGPTIENRRAMASDYPTARETGGIPVVGEISFPRCRACGAEVVPPPPPSRAKYCTTCGVELVQPAARDSGSDDSPDDDDYSPAPDYGNDDNPAEDFQSEND